MNALEVEALVVELGGTRVLDQVSFHAGASEFVCLCGPNGGGKTTLLKAALGLIVPQSGTIRVLGETPVEGRRRVGYLPQRKAFARNFPATATDLIVAARRGTWPLRVRDHEREAARSVLTRVGGEALLDRPLASLSGGETQRVFLARALVNEPALLLLDEPTAGVDAQGRAEFLALLAEIASRGSLAAVLVTHNRDAVRRLAHRVVYLDGTVVAAGLPDDVLGDQSLLPRAFLGHDHVEAGVAVCEED